MIKDKRQAEQEKKEGPIKMENTIKGNVTKKKEDK